MGIRGNIRRDPKRRILRARESIRADGKYQFKYYVDGKPHFVYSWKLEPTVLPLHGKLIDAPYIHHLPQEGRPLAQALREAGYATWHVGKWHLGKSDHYPERYGFDVNIGGCHWGHPPFPLGEREIFDLLSMYIFPSKSTDGAIS